MLDCYVTDKLYLDTFFEVNVSIMGYALEYTGQV